MKRHIYQAVYALIALLFTALPTQAAEEVTYYHNDQLGSPIAATDSAGTVLWQQAYDPWGYKLTSTTNERAYTGHWEDPDTGLSDYQARWYSPTIGRFTRMDPVVWNENNVKSFNRYAYANNSPYRYTDPDGNIPLDTIWDAGNVLWDIGKITVGAVVGNEQWVNDGKIDLAADSLAMAVPYLPAGASRLRHVLDGADDAVDVTRRIDNSVLGKPRIGSANKTDPTHRFNDIIDNYAGYASKFDIPTKGPGGEVVRTSELRQIEGSLNGKDGVFEWIIDQGNVTHRRFIPGGKVTGFPNQIPKP